MKLLVVVIRHIRKRYANRRRGFIDHLYKAIFDI
jgi:hypothetical protein